MIRSALSIVSLDRLENYELLVFYRARARLPPSEPFERGRALVDDLEFYSENHRRLIVEISVVFSSAGAVFFDKI